MLHFTELTRVKLSQLIEASSSLAQPVGLGWAVTVVLVRRWWRGIFF